MYDPWNRFSSSDICLSIIYAPVNVFCPYPTPFFFKLFMYTTIIICPYPPFMLYLQLPMYTFISLPSVVHIHDCSCKCFCPLLYVFFFLNIFIILSLIILFAIWRLNKYILYGKGFLKAHKPPKSVKWNEMYKWKDDMKHPGYEYVPNANVDHTISGQGSAVSTLDHLATTPRAFLEIAMSIHSCLHQNWHLDYVLCCSNANVFM